MKINKEIEEISNLVKDNEIQNIENLRQNKNYLKEKRNMI